MLSRKGKVYNDFLSNKVMKNSLFFGYVGLVIGTIFEIISFFTAHVCQLIVGGTPVEKCRIYVIEFYYLSLNFRFLSERASFLISIAIVILFFGLIGFVIGYVKDKRSKKH